MGGDLTVSLVPWYSPCLICTVHRGCLCIAYRISPRDCCFVTFCTIVLAGFVLHAVLKENFHTLLWLLFPYIYIYFFFPSQSPEASHLVLGDLLHLDPDCPSQPSVMCLPHGMTCVDVPQHLLTVTINATLPRKNNYENPKFYWGDNQPNCKIGGLKWRPRPPPAFPAAGGTGGGSGSQARVRELGQQPSPTDRTYPSAVRAAASKYPRSKAFQKKGVSQKTRLLCK